MIYRRLIIGLIVISVCDALIHHQQQDGNLTYYEAMLQKESNLKASLAQVIAEIQYLNNTLGQLQGLPSMQVVALEDTLADENNMLQQIAGNHTLPINLKSINCSNISDADLQVLQNSLNSINADLYYVGQQIAVLNSSNPNITDNLMLEYQWALIYKTQLQNATAQLNKCPTPSVGNQTNGMGIGNVTNYTNISNLTVPNWIYGNTTAAQYYIKLFQFITSNNVTSCPTQTPFVLNGTTTCSACPMYAPMFDVNVAQCVTGCDAGSYFNSTIHTCVPNPIICPFPGQIYDQSINSCTCAPATPYFTGIICIACYAPNFWNSTSNSCNTCNLALQLYFDPQQNRCLQCPPSTPISTGIDCINCNQTSYYNPNLAACVSCPNGQLYNPTIMQCQCPALAPLFNGYTCTTCPQNQFYDSSSNTCTYCQPGFIFNPTSSACEQCPAYAPISNQNQCQACPANSIFNITLGICVQCGVGQIIVIDSNSNYICSCPQSASYYNGTGCVSCILPLFWNQNTLTCDNCPSGMIYSVSSASCTICPTSAPFASNGRCLACPDGSNYSTLTNQCITCASGSVFDPVSQNCLTSTCPVGTFYSPTFQTCISCPSGTYFDSTQNACIGNNGTIITNCTSNMVLNPSTQQCQCPTLTPYYDGTKCVACSSPNFWSQQQNMCLTCPANTHYNTTIQQCFACPNGTTFDPISYTCLSSNCPQSQPFWDGSKCVACYLPQYWNYQMNGCSSCPSGTNYDIGVNQCVVCQSGFVYNSTIFTCVQYGNNTYGTCPSNSFWNGQTCITCYLPNYWNLDTIRCEACSSGFSYDTTLKKCVQCQSGYIFDLNKYQCVWNGIGSLPVTPTTTVQTMNNCPTYAPYWNGQACISCNSPQYWNTLVNQCQYCPAGQFYDVSTQKCVTCPFGTTFNSVTYSCQ